MPFEYTLWCLINGGVQIVGGWEIFRKSNKRGGPNKRGGGKLGDLYVMIRYKIMFSMPVLKLFHSFSTST